MTESFGIWEEFGRSVSSMSTLRLLHKEEDQVYCLVSSGGNNVLWEWSPADVAKSTNAWPCSCRQPSPRICNSYFWMSLHHLSTPLVSAKPGGHRQNKLLQNATAYALPRDTPGLERPRSIPASHCYGRNAEVLWRWAVWQPWILC